MDINIEAEMEAKEDLYYEEIMINREIKRIKKDNKKVDK